MAVSNDFLVWAGGGNANVLTQAAYAALGNETSGVVAGRASGQQANKTWRQSTIMASVLAQYIGNNANVNTVDDGTTAALLANLQTAVELQSPVWLTDVGAVGSVKVVLTAPLANYIGVPIRIKIGYSQVGVQTTFSACYPIASTVVWNGNVSAKGMAIGMDASFKLGQIIEMVYDGTNFVLSNPQSFRFYNYGIPATDQVICVGDNVRWYFNNVSTIPLRVACGDGGVYRLTLVIQSTNTTNSDWQLNANNITQPGNNISSYSINTIDQQITGLAPSGSGVTTIAPIPAGLVSPSYPISGQVGQIPVVSGLTNGGFFSHDAMNGPYGAGDAQNDNGPSIHELLISTYTTSKMIMWKSAILGSPAITSSRWKDTTTVWTSLGTILDQNASQMVGTVLIERLA